MFLPNFRSLGASQIHHVTLRPGAALMSPLTSKSLNPTLLLARKLHTEEQCTDTTTPNITTTTAATTTTTDYEAKYAEKLHRHAQEKGLSVNELRARVYEEQAKQTKARRKEAAGAPSSKPFAQSSLATPMAQNPVSSEKITQNPRKDSSPVRPLSSILNLPRLLAEPHTTTTTARISALWTAYHAARAGGTGRGYVCASVPVDVYERMARVATRYPSFVVPIPRQGDGTAACEFYFLQWGFHGAPPVPVPAPLQATSDEALARPVEGINPPTSTVLLTPLQEYKSRAAFATPHLVLTHYTDLARTHGVVLLRGEITPASSTSGDGGAEGLRGRFLMEQEDAQMLAMGVQRFYLWGGQGEDTGNEGERLLKVFHENPKQFKWEELLKYVNLAP